MNMFCFYYLGIFFTWISETNDYVSLPDNYEFEMIKKHYIVVGLISYLGLATNVEYDTIHRNTKVHTIILITQL